MSSAGFVSITFIFVLALAATIPSSQTQNLSSSSGNNENEAKQHDDQSAKSTSTMTSEEAEKPKTTSSVKVHEKEFSSPAACVQIDCSPDRTLIGVNFTRPFNGILSVGKLHTSKCRLEGAGEIYYELEVFHNETQCDTEWDSSSNSIFNTLLIRFHPSLETGADIAKNLMCRLAVGEIIVGKKPIRTDSAARAKLAKLKAANARNGQKPKA